MGSVKVVNSIRIVKRYERRQPTVDDGNAETVYDLIEGGPPTMTMMMAFPPYDRVERELSQAIECGWKSIRIVTKKKNVEDDNDDDAELIFVGSKDDKILLARCVKKQNDDGAALTSY